MKKIVLSMLLVILVIIGNNQGEVNAQNNLYKKHFSKEMNYVYETEESIFIGNFSKPELSKINFEDYVSKKYIVIYNLYQDVYDYRSGDYFPGDSMIVYNGDDMLTYSSESQDGDKISSRAFYDVSESLYLNFIDYTSKSVIESINQDTSSDSMIERSSIVMATTSTDTCVWQTRYNTQKVYDNQPKSKITVTIQAKRCRLELTDYWRVDLTTEWNVGDSLSHSATTGHLYEDRWNFTDEGDAYVELKLNNRLVSDPYVGMIQGPEPIHGMFYPLTVPVTTSVTNHAGYEIGATLAGAFNPVKYLGEVSGQMVHTGSFSHTYSYEKETPKYVAMQPGATISEGYLSYNWRFYEFHGDIDTRGITLNRSMGTMVSYNNNSYYTGLGLSIFVGMEVYDSRWWTLPSKSTFTDESGYIGIS